MAISRRDAREAVFGLLFETEFKLQEPKEEIYSLSTENREIEEDAYIRDVYFGVAAHKDEMDELINRHSKGWKITRISRVSRSILRLSVYEMMFCKNIPYSVSINEAIELCKKYDEESARPFINGVLNSVKNEIVEKEQQHE